MFCRDISLNIYRGFLYNRIRQSLLRNFFYCGGKPKFHDRKLSDNPIFGLCGINPNPQNTEKTFYPCRLFFEKHPFLRQNMCLRPLPRRVFDCKVPDSLWIVVKQAKVYRESSAQGKYSTAMAQN